jgi:hypothetical protein
MAALAAFALLAARAARAARALLALAGRRDALRRRAPGERRIARRVGLRALGGGHIGCREEEDGADRGDQQSAE